MEPPPPITGWGCWVRHHRMEPNTNGTSINAKIPNNALNNARRSGSSTSAVTTPVSIEKVAAYYRRELEIDAPHLSEENLVRGIVAVLFPARERG